MPPATHTEVPSFRVHHLPHSFVPRPFYHLFVIVVEFHDLSKHIQISHVKPITESHDRSTYHVSPPTAPKRHRTRPHIPKLMTLIEPNQMIMRKQRNPLRNLRILDSLSEGLQQHRPQPLPLMLLTNSKRVNADGAALVLMADSLVGSGGG